MRYIRRVPISSAALAKRFFYPRDSIHCFYCGNHPGYDRVKFDFTVVPGDGRYCCRLEEKVESFQSTLF